VHDNAHRPSIVLTKNKFTVMKKLIFALGLFLATCSLSAQSIVKDAAGNYSSVSKSKTKTPDKQTGKTFTDTKTGKTYPVYIGSRGGLYVLVTDSSGKPKKKYMPKG
jgi:hypothetical protein